MLPSRKLRLHFSRYSLCYTAAVGALQGTRVCTSHRMPSRQSLQRTICLERQLPLALMCDCVCRSLLRLRRLLRLPRQQSAHRRRRPPRPRHRRRRPAPRSPATPSSSPPSASRCPSTVYNSPKCRFASFQWRPSAATSCYIFSTGMLPPMQFALQHCFTVALLLQCKGRIGRAQLWNPKCGHLNDGCLCCRHRPHWR